MTKSETAVVSYQSYKEENYESKTIQLSSPMLHIGGEVSRLNPFEYVQTSSKVYLPHQEALAKTLHRQSAKFIDDYVDTIEKRQNIDGLLKQALGEDWITAKSPDGIPIFPDIRPKWTLEEGQRVTDIRPMIRNGMGQLYIPGSSIKGAIRTAIAYYLLKHAEKYKVPNSHRVSAIEEQLRSKLDNNQINNRNKSSLDDDLFINNLFTNYSLHYQGKNIPTRNIQNTDFLRAIKVSDSQPLIRKTVTVKKTGKKLFYNVPIIAETIVSSHFEDFNAKYRASIFAEVVYQAKTEFTLKIDHDMLSWFKHNQGMKLPFNSIAELLKICQEFAQEQWDGEYDYWQNIRNRRHRDFNLDFDLIRDFYEKEKCPYALRLGWGSGMNGTTIDWLLTDGLRSEIRDVCGIKSPGFQAPKSRRTIVNSRQEIRYVPGWTKFTV
ncbi:type III-A CRISPR-associated RAMP protein Csm5 [Xenococcus sp. PCC 7305]|uniref:type III-A CRISPR-associated RAMP protein Csm5 n=1 Tax=Xenococcus sp. PCC 7305 TaxID=102125 RepID=UPI00059269CD|nr:type III-A CRISPR-associated RAMP protein Csm5 [Xenococcus sp. PCC 7305]